KDEDKDDDARVGSFVRNESKTQERVVNDDGTVSVIKREVKKDGEVKVEVKTYDENGNKIRVEKYESDNGEEKTRVKVYDETGTKLSDL
ncbi:hypothetical protein KC980_01905, partial [candidate division WWE3 bacterium]|nr:hypothetical protein [candidate division WWE3 bacterium]